MKNKKLRKRLLIWIPVAFLFVSVILLIVCNYYVVSHKMGGINRVANYYDTYESMIEDEKKLQAKYSDPEQDVFKINVEGVSRYIYAIEGLHRCKSHSSNEHCSRMQKREAYIKGTFGSGFDKDDSVFIVIFKNKTDSTYMGLEWIQSDGGNCYRYESGYLAEHQYILQDEKKNYLLGVKFGKTTEEQREIIFNYLIDQIKQKH